MESILDSLLEDILPTVEEVTKVWKELRQRLIEAFAPVAEALEEILEDIDDALYVSKPTFPVPPRRIRTEAPIVDKRSQIRQYSYFRR